MDDLNVTDSSALNYTNYTSDDEHASSSANDGMFTFITEGVILTIVSLFGLVGNLMSILVLVSVKGSFSNLLCGLACFDALFLLTAILAFGLPKLWPWYTNNMFIYIMAVSFGLLHTFRVGSVCVTLAVNFERFYAIVYPLKHFRWKKYLLPFSVAFAVLYNVPKYFEMEIRYSEDGATIDTTKLRRNPTYILLYVFWSKFILVEIIPYFTILICNIFIIVKITKSHKFRKRFSEREVAHSTRRVAGGGGGRGGGGRQAGNGQTRQPSPVEAGGGSSSAARKEEHNLGIVLIGLSTLFIICQSFKIVPDLYELVLCNPTGAGGNCQMDGAIDVIMRLSHLLVCINSSANFIIYYISGQKIRQAWLQTYGPCFGWCCGGGGPKRQQQQVEVMLLGCPDDDRAMTSVTMLNRTKV